MKIKEVSTDDDSSSIFSENTDTMSTDLTNPSISAMKLAKNAMKRRRLRSKKKNNDCARLTVQKDPMKPKKNAERSLKNAILVARSHKMIEELLNDISILEAKRRTYEKRYDKKMTELRSLSKKPKKK